MKFDIVLYERQLDEGLNRIEIANLLEICKGDEVIPIEIQGEYSVAMGFISTDMAKLLHYDYDDLSNNVKSVLYDINNETEDHIYKYDVFSMYLDR